MNTISGRPFKIDILKWLCLLCELHGTFRTREMLACHLQWDHAKVISEWGQMDGTEVSGLSKLVCFDIVSVLRLPSTLANKNL